MVLLFPEILDYNKNRKGRDKHVAEKKKLVPRELLKQFIRENGLKTAEDAQNFVKELFADTIQELLEAEMYESLGYEKNDARNRRPKTGATGITRKQCATNSETSNWTFPATARVNLNH